MVCKRIRLFALAIGLCLGILAFGASRADAACNDGVLNGIFELGEECDDGNTIDGDGCQGSGGGTGPLDCKSEVCGNGRVDFGEDCDDGTGTSASPVAVSTIACDADCTALLCGNGFLDPSEECDDGNLTNIDTCLNDCTLATCGDGEICAATMCTSGPNGGPEECDNRNQNSGDGCSETCKDEGFTGEGRQCVAAVLKEMGKYFSCLMKVYSKAEKKGVFVQIDPDGKCTTKFRDKVRKAFSKAPTPNDCLETGLTGLGECDFGDSDRCGETLGRLGRRVVGSIGIGSVPN